MESFVFLCSLVLFVGSLLTAVTFIYCGTKRYSELWRSGKWIFESLYARRDLIAVLFLFISWTVSTFGLIKIVARGYPFLGYLATVVLFPTLMIVAPIKIYRKYKKIA